jgi:hypothetical protein
MAQPRQSSLELWQRARALAVAIRSGAVPDATIEEILKRYGGSYGGDSTSPN